MVLEEAAFVFFVILAILASIFCAKPRRVDYYVMSGILLIIYALVEAFIFLLKEQQTIAEGGERVFMALLPIVIWLLPSLFGNFSTMFARSGDRASR
jgi:uncharacterized membrane protein YhaH (DUF805 family)